MTRRQSKDLLERYYTPQWVVNLCVNHVLPMAMDRWPISILEPGCGDGAFLPQLRKKYPDTYIHANDLVKQIDPKKEKSVDIFTFIDYLQESSFKGNKFDLIIGNPPFCKATEFIGKSFDLKPKVIVMLLRQTITGSEERANFWRVNRPSHIFSIPNRISFLNAKNGADSAYHHFFVWQKGFRGNTQFVFLPHTPKSKRQKV